MWQNTKCFSQEEKNYKKMHWYNQCTVTKCLNFFLPEFFLKIVVFERFCHAIIILQNILKFKMLQNVITLYIDDSNFKK